MPRAAASRLASYTVLLMCTLASGSESWRGAAHGAAIVSARAQIHFRISVCAAPPELCAALCCAVRVRCRRVPLGVS